MEQEGEEEKLMKKGIEMCSVIHIRNGNIRYYKHTLKKEKKRERRGSKDGCREA